MISRLREIIRRHSIDIVHTYLGLPSFYGAVAGKLSHTKVIATIRIAGPRMRLSDPSERLAFLISDRIISNSKAGVDYYFRFFPGRQKTQVIYNGYDFSEFEIERHKTREDVGLPEGVRIIGHVANLTHLKDYPTFLRALAIVFEREEGCIAAIVGDGEKRKEYEELAKSLGIIERTLFLGHRRDVLDLVRFFDVCVLCSHPKFSEGLSNSIAEYLGMGKPVVATNVGGNKELITNGYNGFLVAPGKPEAVAEKILLLLRDSDLRAEMGERGRRFFRENLSLAKMVSRTQDVYRELVEA